MIHKGLILHYPFNGNAADVSGQEQHGKIFQAFQATNRFGIPNKAFHFDNNQSYIYAKLKKYDYERCTITCWVRWEQQHALSCIFYVGHSGCNGFGLLVSDSDCSAGGNLSLLLGGVRCDAFHGNLKMPSLEWVHLALVKKQSEWTLYKNGKKQITTVYHYNTPDEFFSVGGTITNINTCLGGLIEDFRWYNRALSPIAIKKLYNLQEADNVI